jgi:hypothetical protein
MKFIPPSTGDAVDHEPSRLPSVISPPCGDIGVGGARLLFSDDIWVREGGCRKLW